MDYFRKQWLSENLAAATARIHGDRDGEQEYEGKAKMWARISTNSETSRSEGKGGKHRGEH